MASGARFLAVVDPGVPEPVIQRALELTRQYPGALRFVTLFDTSTPLDRELPPEEAFRKAEAEQRARLMEQVAGVDSGAWFCEVLSGPPAEAMARLTARWGATLVLTDRATARLFYGGWFPFQQTDTPLPCPILVVEPALPVLTWFAQGLRSLIHAARPRQA